MGKWTPDYTDDVLHSKISTLVSGAIRRLAVERGTTSSITYENFVTDLDTGDAFTATLMDTLVKEIADRRLRTNASERTLLSERTVQSLRSLVSSSRTYTNRFRFHARRPAVNIPEYLSAPPAPELDLMEDEDEEFEMEMPVDGTAELHDAYSRSRVPSWSFSAVPARRGMTSSPSPSDEWHPPHPSSSSSAAAMSPSNPAPPRPSWQNSLTVPSHLPPGPALSRQGTIRRATRIRVDFNESAQRRRMATREFSERVGGGGAAVAESVTEPRDGLVWNRPLNSASRRFFPLQRSRRRDPWAAGWVEGREGMSPDGEDVEFIPPSAWSEPATTTMVDAGMTPEWTVAQRFEPDERAVFRVPRLRRGGVVPPESVVSRRASPVIVGLAEDGPGGSAAPPPVVVVTPPPLDNTVSGRTSAIVIPVSPTLSPPPPPPLIPPGEIMGYSSPGFTEHDNLT